MIESLNNEQLLGVIRDICPAKEPADLLKKRWESFWEHDYRTLATQRHTIDSLTRQLSQARQELAKLASQLRSEQERFKHGFNGEVSREVGRRLGRRFGKSAKQMHARYYKFAKELTQLYQESAATHIPPNEFRLVIAEFQTAVEAQAR